MCVRNNSSFHFHLIIVAISWRIMCVLCYIFLLFSVAFVLVVYCLVNCGYCVLICAEYSVLKSVLELGVNTYC